MRVLIYEFIAGGGMVHTALPRDLLPMGHAMLRAVVSEFAAAGCEVVTTRDHRVPHTPAAHNLTITSAADLVAVFDDLPRLCQAALVIAPEFDGILESLLRRVEKSGVRNLGCASIVAQLCSDKLALSRHLLDAGVPTPATVAWSPGQRIAFPAVVKPRYGVGCEDTFICRSDADLAKLPPRTDWISQPLLPGAPASVSFVHGRPLLAGSQRIEGQAQLRYRGGTLPLPPELSHRAASLGDRCLRTLPGMASYIGIDLLLGESPEQDAVVEINPRITMSFIALQLLCATNLARAILDPVAPLSFRDSALSYDGNGQLLPGVSR